MKSYEGKGASQSSIASLPFHFHHNDCNFTLCLCTFALLHFRLRYFALLHLRPIEESAKVEVALLEDHKIDLLILIS